MGKLDHFFKEKGTALMFSQEEYMDNVMSQLTMEEHMHMDTEKVRQFMIRKMDIKGPAFDDGTITWDGKMGNSVVKVMDMNTRIEPEFIRKLAGCLLPPFREKYVTLVTNNFWSVLYYDLIRINGIHFSILELPFSLVDAITADADYDLLSKEFDRWFSRTRYLVDTEEENRKERENKRKNGIQ